MIRTVLGDIPGSLLRHAQCHEHVFVAETPAAKTYPDLCADDPALSLEELRRYQEAGGNLIVDAQPVLAGRMAEALLDAAIRTGVLIVGVTGFHKGMFYREDCPLRAMDAEALAALYISEIRTGMLGASLTERTAARAGMVKIAFDAALPGGLPMAATEGALAAAEATGAPILVHTEKGLSPLPLIERAAKAGLAPSRFIVCHLDRTCDDIGVHAAVAEAGAYLNYDSIHRFKYISAEDERRLILAMLERGHGGRLMLSLDTTRSRLTSYGGEIGLDYILRSYIGELEAAGVGREHIKRMTAQNAAAALQFV